MQEEKNKSEIFVEGTMLIMWIKILEIFTLINALACDKIHKIN
jgi:hypothetical protein